jgi:lipoprotein-anchoring transpeptidase ErfK/SrfK
MPSWRAIASGVASLLLISVTGCVTAPASREADPAFARQTVAYATHEAPGTIVIDPASHFLYLVQGGGKAIRSPVVTLALFGRA